MNPLLCSRFSKGLSSGLSILAFIAVGYTLSGETVLAADGPSEAKASQPAFKEVPGLFKDLSGTQHPITSKQTIEAAPSITTGQTPGTPLAVDADKGIANKSSYIGEASELLDFQATAYCLRGRTASGINTRPGVIAADPRVLPLGTVVHIRAGRYTGRYTVLDTGSKIKGRMIDIYLPDYHEAKIFGRRKIQVSVIGGAPRRIESRPSADPARKSVEAATM